MKLIIKEAVQIPALDNNLKNQIKNLMLNKSLSTADIAIEKGYAAAVQAVGAGRLTADKIIGYAAGAADAYAKPMPLGGFPTK